MFKPQLPPTRREADDSAELIRTDVFYAVSAAAGFLKSTNPVLKGLAETGKLDDRCTSAPVLVGAL